MAHRKGAKGAKQKRNGRFWSGWREYGNDPGHSNRHVVGPNSEIQSMRTQHERDAINELSNAVIGAAIEVHRIMGPGLLESVYEECLRIELASKGIPSRTQVPTPLRYKGTDLRATYRADLVIASTLLVEVKSVDKLAPIHDAQVLTYLKLLNLPLGFLFNFNETLLKNGLRRLANGI